MTSRSSLAITASSAAGSPHHQVATEGIFSGSPSRRLDSAGRKPSRAPDSSRLDPRLLAISTLPRRAACGQPGHAEHRAAQFERIARFVVDPAHDHVHAVQAGQGLEEDDAVAHREVAAFDQRQAEVARQVGLLVIAFVARARREQHDQRHLAVAQRRRRIALGRAQRGPSAPGCRAWCGRSRASGCTFSSRSRSGKVGEMMERFSSA